MAATRENVEMSDTRKDFVENITPHKICVVVFIREYCSFKQACMRPARPTPEWLVFSPKYRRVFNMLALKLIQCPDMEYKDLYNLLNVDRYPLLQKHLTLFNEKISAMLEGGVGSILDLASMMDFLMVDPVNTTLSCVINRSSVIGLYLRRIMLALDRLSFSEVSTLFHAFRKYVNRGLQRSAGDGMDVEEDHIMTLRARNSIENEQSLWSRKQADLFIAQQASLLQTNEGKALSPRDLNKKIKELLVQNKDYAEAHYLSYLNNIRVREFCGSISSIHHCFDRGAACDDKTLEGKGFRYAALNLAMLHSQFKHKEETLAAVKESITLAQECGDNVCLQHALSLLAHCTSMGNKHAHSNLLQHAVTRSMDLSLSHAASLAMQARVQHLALTGNVPQALFEVMRRSDVLNCQNSFVDLMSNSYAQKSALWHLYGKADMSSLFSQLFLQLNTAYMTQGNHTYNGEGSCQAVCGVSHHLPYGLASTVLGHARERFPREPLAQNWMLTEQTLSFYHNLHLGKWKDAEITTNQILSINKWKSLLLKAELNLAFGNEPTAELCLNRIMDNCSRDPDEKNITQIKVQTAILSAQLQRCVMSSVGNVIHVLNSALVLSSKNYLDYDSGIIELNLAHVQLLMGLPTQALRILDRALLGVLTHGDAYNHARALLLYVKCRVAATDQNDARRQEIIAVCAGMLDYVRLCLEKVEAFSKVKDVLYLQAVLYDEVKNVAARNKCALEFRLLDEQYPMSDSNSLLTSF